MMMRKIVARADKISAASDRTEENVYQKGAHLKRQLNSVICRIKLNNSISQKYGYKLERLSPSSIFPEQIVQEADLTASYKSLWDGFTKIAKEAFGSYKSSDGINQFVMLLSSLLQKYCWCIPSATNDLFCDISLYDHAVSTATVALVLKILQKENAYPQKPFLFFAGDVSGIQDFIFQHHQEAFKGSAKIIRGRSMYIATISHLYTHVLCKALGIPPFVQLLNAGGKFTLLLPNLQEVKDKIEEVVLELDKWFFDNFHGDFTIVHDWSIEAHEDDLKPEAFKNIIRKINYNLALAKNQKFSSILKAGNCVIDVKYDEQELCKACGRYSPIKGLEESRCEKCQEMFTLGSKITKRSLIVFHDDKGDVTFGFSTTVSLSICENRNEVKNPICIYTFDESNDAFPLFVCNNYVPLIDNEVMDFERIAQSALHEVKAEQDRDDSEKKYFRGTKRLAYVKVDVDNMGSIFSNGIEHLSIARYVTLSRMFHLFFNLHVKHLLESSYTNFYTVFSGGDDLFLIAPWDEVLHFVDDLELNFKKFVCYHPNLHFSTGVLIQKHNYPMSKAAKIAEEKLEMAKNAGRNYLLYFLPVSYNKMREIHNRAHWLVERYEDDTSKINHAFLYRFLQYARMSKRVKRRASAPSDLLYIPFFKYDVVRNICNTDSKGNILNMEEIAKLEEIFYTYLGEPEILEVILQVVLYSTREHTIHKGGNQ